MEWKTEPIWDSMVRDHGNPFENQVDKPEKHPVPSSQRQQPKRKQPKSRR